MFPRPEVGQPAPDHPSGVGVLDRKPFDRVSKVIGQFCNAAVGDNAPQYRINHPGHDPRVRQILGKLDGFEYCGMVGNTIQKQKLIEPELQDAPQRRITFQTVIRQKAVDTIIKPDPPPENAVDDFENEPLIAAVHVRRF